MADYSTNSRQTLGVTFSPIYTRYLGLDVKKTYATILNEIGVKHIRIPTYWSEYEKIEGKIDFTEIDYLVTEASKNNASIILVVGMKQPRWPECHIPEWAKQLSPKDRQEKLLKYVEKTVMRYKDNRVITAWQVENEPFFGFGEMCDKIEIEFLKREIKLVKSLDKRPVIVTDTGEWSSWVKASQVSDILGVSLYRKAYNSVIGYFDYPLPSALYTLKSKFIKKFTSPNNQKTIVSELQTEPWLKTGVRDTSIEDQVGLFGIIEFMKTVDYAKKTGFDEIYLWGIEWWFYMAQNGHPEYLNYAKELYAR